MDHRAEIEQHRAIALRVSMASLVANPHFQAFMAEVERMKEESVREACRADGYEDRDASLGAVRCYNELLDSYREASGGGATLD